MTISYFTKRIALISTMRKDTKKKLKKVIEFRLKGHSFEEIGAYFKVTKSRIFEMEKEFTSVLSLNDKDKYYESISLAKKKLTSLT